ncbi:unnamed protein product [Bemisia tabaci]|uniref:Uncharacterized protein n=1 Tax=Bemisia tabaci TaxID=7038 RepID=A0A9P0A7N4_BEMTA|nr:PREDICTED: uncharacterized protein LOC109034287 [Bemisia tabaci]CAH0388296.1 unnamed protein product [Bemisia tabaci]
MSTEKSDSDGAANQDPESSDSASALQVPQPRESPSRSSSMSRLSQPDAGQWADQKSGSTELRGTSARSENENDDSDSELSDSENFLAKGAFLLTPSNDLTMEKASSICEKMNFKGPYSLTKTATGILFKFAEPEDYQVTFKKGFHKVTGARFYKKIPIPCRPQKTFVVFVLEVPEEIPEEDIRHSLYKFHSVVEVSRLSPTQGGSSASTSNIPAPVRSADKGSAGGAMGAPSGPDPSAGSSAPPPIVRVTLASLDECNVLLQNGFDFFGATFFPTEPAIPTSLVRTGAKKLTVNNSRLSDLVASNGQRIRDALPVFDAAGFAKIPPPATKTIVPRF